MTRRSCTRRPIKCHCDAARFASNEQIVTRADVPRRPTDKTTRRHPVGRCLQNWPSAACHPRSALRGGASSCARQSRQHGPAADGLSGGGGLRPGCRSRQRSGHRARILPHRFAALRRSALHGQRIRAARCSLRSSCVWRGGGDPCCAGPHQSRLRAHLAGSCPRAPPHAPSRARWPTSSSVSVWKGCSTGRASTCTTATLPHNRETTERVARGKTVSLIRLTLVLPAMLGGASAREIQLLERIALYWGLGYQMVDDLKDVLRERGRSRKDRCPRSAARSAQRRLRNGNSRRRRAPHSLHSSGRQDASSASAIEAGLVISCQAPQRPGGGTCASHRERTAHAGRLETRP